MFKKKKKPITRLFVQGHEFWVKGSRVETMVIIEQATNDNDFCHFELANGVGACLIRARDVGAMR